MVYIYIFFFSLQAFSGHRLLSESDVNAAIKILSEANPSYPVQRFYEMAKTKNKNSLKPEVESTEPKEKPGNWLFYYKCEMLKLFLYRSCVEKTNVCFKTPSMNLIY